MRKSSDSFNNAEANEIYAAPSHNLAATEQCSIPNSDGGSRNANGEYFPAPWISSTQQSPTSHGMLQHRQPAPMLWKAAPQPESHQIAHRPLGMQNARRSRHFVPVSRKDEGYWMKRRKNNEAARKSREKRRTNDMILAQKVLLLLQENLQLKKDLLALRMKYNEIDSEEVNDFRKRLEDGDLLSGITQNLNLSDYGIPDSVVQALSNGMDLSLPPFPEAANKQGLTTPTQLSQTAVAPCIEMDAQKCGEASDGEHTSYSNLIRPICTGQNENFISRPHVQGMIISTMQGGTESQSMVSGDGAGNHTDWTYHDVSGAGKSDESLRKRTHDGSDSTLDNIKLRAPRSVECLVKTELAGGVANGSEIPQHAFVRPEDQVISPLLAGRQPLTRNSLLEAEMLQNFVQSSWQRASECSSMSQSYHSASSSQSNSPALVSDHPTFSCRNRVHSIATPCQSQSRCAVTSSTPLGMTSACHALSISRARPPVRTVSLSPTSSEEHTSSSNPSSLGQTSFLQKSPSQRGSRSSSSDEGQMSWRKISELSDDGSKQAESTPYDSSSDMGSTSGGSVSSPKGSSNHEDSNENSSADEKSCRLPYKLRFKMAAMQG